ncbi:uncharacterized protein LOC131672382, partial [Phymastichus coffea]|uniref:uncharacterized protein LOC131672382 n=1 Tax=Phymastichus coffea TaxID=108790 RepID=UPI00273C95E9
MAYVLWRVLMKKYSKVRLGIRNFPVIPAERRAITDKESTETWSLAVEQQAPESSDVSTAKIADEKPELDADQPPISRGHETRKSKSKRVKSYLKRCKGALTRAEDASCERKKSIERRQQQEQQEQQQQQQQQQQQTSCAWYVESRKESAKTEEEEEDEGEPVFELCKAAGSRNSLYEDAREELRTKAEEEEEEEEKSAKAGDDGSLNKCDSSDTLIAPQEAKDDSEEDAGPATPTIIPNTVVRADAASLIRTYLGPIYGENVLDILTRQARDILVCAYHGNLENFVKCYLTPAVKLLSEVKLVASNKGNALVTPEGWPLTLGGHGLVLRLGELEASALRLGECYLCVRSAAALASAATVTLDSATLAAPVTAEQQRKDSVEIALVWRSSSMRAPGLLGWELEDELTVGSEWREPLVAAAAAPNSSSSALSTTSSSTASSVDSATRWTHHHHHHRNHRRYHHESRSTERHHHNHHRHREDSFASRSSAIDELLGHHDVVKSKSSSSVDAWAEEARAASERRSTSSSRCAGERDNQAHGFPAYAAAAPDHRSKLKRGTRVVSPATMEKWKETSRCETRSRVLAPRDLATPVALETVATIEPPFKDRQLANGDATALHRFEHVSRPDQVSDLELPAYISTLLVTVERKIERVNVDDLTFPCTACRNIDTDDPLLGCKCAGDSCECVNEANCECGDAGLPKLETARSFEIAGIKHIDSDDEEEVRMGFGTKKRIDDVTAPRTIHEISERALNCGLTLPGYADVASRPVLEFDGGSTRREVVSSREMATLLLYLARLPSVDSSQEFALLVNANSKEEVETLDRALNLVKGKLRAAQAYLLRSAPEGRSCDLFTRSHLKTVNVDESTLEKHIPRRTTDYNHEHCVAFYKEYDSVMTEWQAAGRRLALEMSELKECTSLSGSLTPLNRLLADPTLRRTAQDAEEVMAQLEERAASLANVDHVRLSLERARRLVEEVGNAATRLESSFESRRATIRNLAVLRSIEDQARE